MQGVHLSFNQESNELVIKINTSGLLRAISSDDLKKYIRSGKYINHYLNSEAFEEVIAKANLDFESNVVNEYEKVIGCAKDAEYNVVMSKDKMTAELIITAPYAGKIKTVAEVINVCKEQGVNRGLSKKRIQTLLTQLKGALPGDQISAVVAAGLPPKAGRPTTLVQLVPNILDRVLQPRIDDKDIADMRELGEIVSVLSGTPIARIKPETKGRDGFSVDGKAIKAKPGKKQNFKLDGNVHFAENDEHLIVAEKTGMPSFSGNKIKIDDVFSTKGVSVGTGNIDFNGAVVVNGDVADKMKIIATGDVTINGFVESAIIETSGNILITQGAAGQTVHADQKPNCVLKAKGDILVANAQGCTIECGGNLHVQKQLAFSHIQCAGSVFVGKTPDKPDGTLLGCKIFARGDIAAGVIGATSGSKILIDFGTELNKLNQGKESLHKTFKKVEAKFSTHHEKLQALKNKKVPAELEDKVALLEEAVISEKQLLNWIKDKIEDGEMLEANFPMYLRIKATQALHAGVTLQYNQFKWHSEREFSPIVVAFKDSKWNADPITV